VVDGKIVAVLNFSVAVLRDPAESHLNAQPELSLAGFSGSTYPRPGPHPLRAGPSLFRDHVNLMHMQQDHRFSMVRNEFDAGTPTDNDFDAAVMNLPQPSGRDLSLGL
jgi:hypothetical protein